MNEIEGLRLQPALEQIIDYEFYVGDSFGVQKCTSAIEQAFVYVGAHDLTGGPDPLAEDPKPAHGSAADVQSAFAGSAVELRVQLQALQLRGLVCQQVLLRHGAQYLPSGAWGASYPQPRG